MKLMADIRRKDAEALMHHTDTANLQIRLIPRDEWRSRWGAKADPEDKDWFILDCGGPPEQVAKLSHHPALGDPAYLNLMVTVGNVEELPFLYG